MRNAVQADIENIRNGKPPEFDVMYYNPNGYKIHRRYGAGCVEDFLPDGVYLFESADGKMLWPAVAENLFYKPKGQGTPAKPKKPHVKGTKPFVYSPANIKVGTKVKCRDGSVQVVKELWCTWNSLRQDAVCFVGYTNIDLNGNVWLKDGRMHNNYEQGGRDIVYIYPQQENKVEDDSFEKWYTGKYLPMLAGGTTKDYLQAAFNAGKESK